MRLELGLKESVIGFMLDCREMDKVGFFELIADTGPELFKVFLADFLLIFMIFGFGVRLLDVIKRVIVDLRGAFDG